MNSLLDNINITENNKIIYINVILIKNIESRHSYLVKLIIIYEYISKIYFYNFYNINNILKIRELKFKNK